MSGRDDSFVIYCESVFAFFKTDFLLIFLFLLFFQSVLSLIWPNPTTAEGGVAAAGEWMVVTQGERDSDGHGDRRSPVLMVDYG